ncbi:MAG: arylformamidase [Patescibacteria group bacterium]|nr:arylformamidase [Patescibacteria group bacterium]
MKIIDISLPIKPGMMVYPGNPEVVIELAQDIECGASSNVSKMSLGSHTGTHIDAPRHVFKEGEPIDKFALEAFFGPCKVFDATSEEKQVSLYFVESKEIQKGDRVLFKTKNSERGFETFRNDFVFLSGEASEYLAKKEISLVGIDYLSIKEKGSKDNRPHTEFLSRGIPILEGIDLSRVTEGEYVISAFPLKIEGADGALARAVLIED